VNVGVDLIEIERIRRALDRLYDRALEIGVLASRPRLDVV